MLFVYEYCLICYTKCLIFISKQEKKACQHARQLSVSNTIPRLKGGFPVMAEITRILAANIPRQFFFVITTTANTPCLVQNFQLICYPQRVNATSQYNDSGSSRCSKWPKDRMVAVVKHCWLPCTRKKRLQRKMTKDNYWIGVQKNIGMFSKF